MTHKRKTERKRVRKLETTGLLLLRVLSLTMDVFLLYWKFFK